MGFLDYICNALKLVAGEPGERWIAFEEPRDIHGSKYEASI